MNTDVLANEPSFPQWKKSSRSGSAGDNCVEVATATDGTTIGVRDSKDPHGPALATAASAWHHFTQAVTSGELIIP